MPDINDTGHFFSLCKENTNQGFLVEKKIARSICIGQGTPVAPTEVMKHAMTCIWGTKQAYTAATSIFHRVIVLAQTGCKFFSFLMSALWLWEEAAELCEWCSKSTNSTSSKVCGF